MECFNATAEDIAFFEQEGGPSGPSSTGGKQQEPAPDEESTESGQEAEQSEETPSREDLVIRCEPVLDPVNGIAANELGIGESVLAKLPQDSVFFKLLSRNVPDFNGIITATVTGILMNELGTSNISLSLSDGVTGLMKMSGKVRIKVAPKQGDAKKNTARLPMKLPAGFGFGMAGAIIFIFAVAAVYYILR
jgi:translation initiation factor IF-1